LFRRKAWRLPPAPTDSGLCRLSLEWGARSPGCWYTGRRQRSTSLVGLFESEVELAFLKGGGHETYLQIPRINSGSLQIM
jgi:hypothetical protein